MEEQTTRPDFATLEDWEKIDNIMVVDYGQIDFNELFSGEQWQTIKDTHEMRGVDVWFRTQWLPKNGYEVTRDNLFDDTLHADGVVIE